MIGKQVSIFPRVSFKPAWVRVLSCLALVSWGFCVLAEGNASLSAPHLRVLSRQLRVDLVWDQPESPVGFEVQRASSLAGPFEPLHRGLPEVSIYSDFLGQPGGDYFYKVRSVQPKGGVVSDWSSVVKGSPHPSNVEDLLTEVQEAAFRYFYEYGHPTAGLAREGTGRDPDECAIGASGMGLHNLVVGVERGFITREQGVDRALKELRFLSGKAERFHGAFPHLLNGQTGKVIPFSRYDDGADLVETAFLMQGILLLREYFDGSSPQENDLRCLANLLWRSVEWDWFAREEDSALFWHWSPNYGWKMHMPITGFNECQIVYALALVSPTHPVQTKFYTHGWQSSQFGSDRTQFGVALKLGHEVGPPLFFTHYSYLGLDPRQITYGGRSYFEHFQDLCHVQIRYAELGSKKFKNYGPLWGITSSQGPDGYRASSPGQWDDGTLAPTAALSSMPYVPDESRACLSEMYEKHGRLLWGPFGFYDAFNFSRDWVAADYLGIDVGPIAPMIENYRTGLCWKTFMRAPEIGATIKLMAGPQSPQIGIAAGVLPLVREPVKQLSSSHF